MKKRFLIKTPEQLTNLGAFLKDGDVTNLVKVWTVKLRKDGVSPWDGKVFALFCSDNGRKAYIGRKCGAGCTINYSLKYNPALKWCEEHLEPIASDKW